MKNLCVVILFGLSLTSSGSADEKVAKARRIDVHLHAYSVESMTKIFGKDMMGVRAVASDTELIAKTMLELDKNNIRWAVVSGHDELIDKWMAKHPNRLIRSYAPDLGKPDFRTQDHDSLAKQLAKQIANKEIRAIGELGLAYNKMPLNEKVLWPYYRVAEGKVPVFFHTGLGPRRNHGEFNNPKFLSDIATAFPKLIIVACHMGEGQHDELIEVMLEHENIYADISVVNWVSQDLCDTALKMLKEKGLLKRVLYGSDQMIFPELVSRSVMFVEGAGLSDEEKHAVFWGNAARILGISDSNRLGDKRQD